MIRRVQLGLLSVAAISFVTAMVLASSARDAMAAPNLVTNGDFATDVTGWTSDLPGDITIAHSTDDAESNPSSGSGEVTWSSVGAGVGTISTACIDLTAAGSGTYELVGAIKNPVANGPGVLVSVQVQFFAETTCATPAGVPFDTGSVPNDGNWTPVSNTSIAVTTELGAIVSLVIDADDTDATGVLRQRCIEQRTCRLRRRLTPARQRIRRPTRRHLCRRTRRRLCRRTRRRLCRRTRRCRHQQTRRCRRRRIRPCRPTRPCRRRRTRRCRRTPQAARQTRRRTHRPRRTRRSQQRRTRRFRRRRRTRAVPTNTPAATQHAGTRLLRARRWRRTRRPPPELRQQSQRQLTPPCPSRPSPSAPRRPAQSEAPAKHGGAGGAGGDPSAAGELPETGSGAQAVEDLTMPLVMAGLLALIGAMALAGVEFHRIRQ